MGFEVIAIDKNPEAVGKEYSDIFYPIDVMDKEKALEAAQKHKISGLATIGTNMAICTVSYIATALHQDHRYISPEIALQASQKSLFRKILSAYDLIPKGISSKNFDELSASIDLIDFPLLVKPSDSSGGRGISILFQKDNKAIKEAFEYAQSYTYGGEVIFEEFVIGPVIGVESFTQKGVTTPLVIADKIISEPPDCVTLGVTLPTRLDESLQRQIIEANKACIGALGISSGPTHIDMVISKSGPKIIDVGPRLAAGPIIFELIPKMTGFDLLDATIKMALGESVRCKPQKFPKIFCGSRFLCAPQKGILKGIKYNEDILRNYQLINIEIRKSPGEKVVIPRNDNDRLGVVTAYGDSYDKVTFNLESILKNIRIDIE